MIGRTLDGQYRVDGILGEGAMGVVFRGVNLAMDKSVAIKMMRKETFDTPDALERFRREARVWSKLNHPAITQVFDYGVQDGMPFLVMEHVEGVDLSDVIKNEGPLKPHRAVSLMRQLAAALEEAHRNGIIHRDIKPQNLKLLRYQPGGRITLKVLDFGMAKQVGNKDRAMSLTAPGMLVGTPKYVAPEQVTENPKIDGRTDLYAAGVLFYEVLTGNAPFIGTPHEVLFAHLGSQPKPLPEHVPQIVSDVVMKLLRKKPEERYQNAQELDSALEDCEEAMRAPYGGGLSGAVFAPVGANGGAPSGSSGSQPRTPPSGRSSPPSGRSSPPVDQAPSRPSVPSSPAAGSNPTTSPVKRRRWPWLLFGLVVVAAGGSYAALSTSLPVQRYVAGALPAYKVPQDEAVQRALATLRDAAQNKSWAAMLSGTTDLQSRYGATLLPAQKQELEALRQQATLEQSMQQIYEHLVAAAAKQEHVEVIKLVGQLAADSTYRSMAQPFFDASSEAFVTAQLSRAEALRQDHRCSEFTATVQAVLELLPGQPQATAELRKECSAAPTVTPVLGAEELEGSAALTAAHQKYLEGKYAEALAEATTLSGDKDKALAARAQRLQLCAACRTGDLELLNKQIKKLDADTSAKVAAACQASGIEISGGQARKAEAPKPEAAAP
ncbi:MAG: protein kinase [Polyangia bacterium]